MKTITHSKHNPFQITLLAILSLGLAFFSQSAFADSTYTTTVTIQDYYGARGIDSDGNRMYGVKVLHRGIPYYVEMHNPMPCLSSHRNERAQVTINRHSECWGDVIFEGKMARIHNVVRLEDHDDHNHSSQASNRYDSGHQHRVTTPKPWSPFSWLK